MFASGAADAELVAFGVGELEPTEAVLGERLLVQAPGPKRLEASSLRVDVGDPEIDMHAILLSPGLRYLL
jgi:hypothetical protein